MDMQLDTLLIMILSKYFQMVKLCIITLKLKLLKQFFLMVNKFLSLQIISYKSIIQIIQNKLYFLMDH